MILRGILDRSLSSQICIRGFAPIKELAKISRADYSYQRNPIYEQQEEISTFLDEEEFLFFPEVILSYKIKSDYSKLKDKSLTPIQLLEQKGSFKSNIDKSTLKTKNVNYKDKSDIRGSEQIKVVELYLDDAILKEAIEDEEEPFNRVDGNHRLKAAELATSEKVQRMQVPFCIILTEEITDEIVAYDGTVVRETKSNNEKFERAVFHNINTKTIPLTSEENLRVILDDTVNFPNDELKEKFGWEYLAIRKVYQELPKNIEESYPNLGQKFLEQPRTLSKHLISILLKNKKITKTNSSIKKVNEALKEVNQIFGNHPKLTASNDISFVATALYLFITKDYNIDIFINWLFKNHIIEIKGLSPISLINIYSKIRESKSKQVFVSMQFDEETKPHYEAIVKVIEEVNDEFDLDIQLREIRIDNFNVGHSYKIDDEILSLIEESGLLIADLSSKNINVYQELGYLMGLNQGKGLKQENFILIKRQDKDSQETDIGFNIRPFQQLRFNSEMELMKNLKSSIIEYYELGK
ncbi:hypothetical protein [Polaribacter sp. L3A8]|uniref:hypothetical protein n=1 Tax=Polaribacter sp. L3A8 TaxID=2686361 RepID=UPI00131B9C8C|nr:hypothetical protein [Polaribacter sp. L3A8]